MTYVRPEWKWYVVQLVTETRVDGDPRLVGGLDIVLLHADSPEEAYGKALAMIDDYEYVYRNVEGVPVRERCLGIANLDIIQEVDLKDGTDLAQRIMTDVSSEELQGLVRDKEQLSLFGTPPYDGPIIWQ